MRSWWVIPLLLRFLLAPGQLGKVGLCQNCNRWGEAWGGAAGRGSVSSFEKGEEPPPSSSLHVSRSCPLLLGRPALSWFRRFSFLQAVGGKGVLRRTGSPLPPPPFSFLQKEKVGFPFSYLVANVSGGITGASGSCLYREKGGGRRLRWLQFGK